MADDVARSKEENDLIRKETEDLDVKFQELAKECQEKMELMDKQIEEQNNKQNGIEDTLTTQIDTQAEELKKQVEAYKEQTKLKLDEEQQLISVLKSYKQKYQEFKQATLFSKKNHKKFAKEVQALGNRKRALETEKASYCSQLHIEGNPEDITQRIEERMNGIAAD